MAGAESFEIFCRCFRALLCYLNVRYVVIAVIQLHILIGEMWLWVAEGVAEKWLLLSKVWGVFHVSSILSWSVMASHGTWFEASCMFLLKRTMQNDTCERKMQGRMADSRTLAVGKQRWQQERYCTTTACRGCHVTDWLTDQPLLHILNSASLTPGWVLCWIHRTHKNFQKTLFTHFSCLCTY